MIKGKLIVIEGVDGSGKSTLTQRLAQAIGAAHRGQPGGTPVADALRSIFKTNTKETITPLSEIFILMAARAQLWENVVSPALESGTNVILDRHLLSTLVYQVDLSGSAQDEDFVRHLNNRSFPYTPDLMIFLDVDEATSQDRRGVRDTSDRKEQSLNFQKLTHAYSKRITQIKKGGYSSDSLCKEFLLVDARGTQNAIFEYTLASVLTTLGGLE
jgi:dTMP kinase